ncbi:hypothetical protein [Corynebacterium fournieri]|uniref:hypothetical protein n=1 Tax=Corynebacterium fournieri TaxID=1852390 RepID=UPI000C78C41F|nr:hypothetical protein [Corynebacterium fournieri]WJY96724.1 hypothetical protein CFOUR_01410 [Corynebacterium fournieri]
MDNETRQYGPQGGEPRRERPRQYFPDQSQNQYQQPQPQPRYEERYAQPAYEQQQYQQPYQDPYYDNGYEPEPEKGTSAGAIALGVFAALSFIAAVVLAVLWRGAAAEANKPPVTETSTIVQTTTERETKTETTTKFPSIFRDRDNPTATLEPTEPTPDPNEIEREIRDGARDILDQLRGGADEYLQEQ